MRIALLAATGSVRRVVGSPWLWVAGGSILLFAFFLFRTRKP